MTLCVADDGCREIIADCLIAFRKFEVSATRTARRKSTPLKRKALFAVVVSLAFWGGLELTLRLTGFSYRTDVESLQFTFPIDEYNAESDEPFLQRDRTVFWKPRPNVLGHNSHGLVGMDFQDAKPEGVFRIVCLGDSCTHFGPDSYPEQWHASLSELAPGKYEVVNAGCIGYSSYQGLTRLKHEVLRWSPHSAHRSYRRNPATHSMHVSASPYLR